MPKPYDPLSFQLYQHFDFENATDAQKEVLARENAHCSKTFPHSHQVWKTYYCPEPVQLDKAR